MKGPAPADLTRWSEDVARDPASLSFLPLARAYRRQGRRDAALKLCLRGLEHHHAHVEAHGLLAMLYFESGQRAKAYDEWSMVLRLDPDHFEAQRGMGFYHLEQGQDSIARRHLDRAAAMKPNDPAVQEALRILAERLAPQPAAPPPAVAEPDPWESPAIWAAQQAAAAPPPGVAGPVGTGDPAAARGTGGLGDWATGSPAGPPSSAPAAGRAEPAPASAEVGAATPPVSQSPSPPVPRAETTPPAAPVPRADSPLPDNPSQLFDSLLRGGQVLGGLLLDEQGLVLAGSLTGETGSRAEALGAILGGAIEEAARTASHLRLGSWKGILLEADQALLHLGPVGQGMVVLLAAKKDAPVGWVMRAATQAHGLATRFLEVYT